MKLPSPYLTPIVAYIVLPSLILLLHLVFSRIVIAYTGRKFALSFINLFIYPLFFSAVLSLTYSFLLNKEWLLSSLVGGFIGYYSSLLLSLIPASGIHHFFAELDIEFLLLNLGCALGTQHPLNLKGLAIPVILTFTVSAIFSLAVKQSTKGLLLSSTEKLDMLKNMMLIYSLCCAAVSIPVSIFFVKVCM